MSAFLLFADGAAERRKADRKEVQRAGLFQRRILRGYGVAATCAAALAVANAGIARRSRRRRLRDPTVFIPGSQSRMQKARWSVRACRYRMRLGSYGAAFCLVVGVGSQICREPPFPYGVATALLGRRSGVKNAPATPSYPVNCRISGNGVEPELPITAGLSPEPAHSRRGGNLSSPGYPMRRRTSGPPGRAPCTPASLPEPADKSYPEAPSFER